MPPHRPEARQGVGVTTNDPGRWLIYRQGDAPEAAAPILDRDEDQYFVEQGGEIIAIRKERGRQREVATTSLDLLRVRDQQALSTRFEGDPTGVVVSLLADHAPRELTKEELTTHLGRLGLDLSTELWKQIQPSLKKHPNVVALTKPPRYAWTAEPRTPAAAADPEALLSRLFNRRTKETQRGEALAQLGSLAEEGRLSPVQIVLVRHAGATAIPAPAWDSVALDELDGGLAERVLDAAGEARAWDWLRGVATEPGSPARAAHAAALLTGATDAVRVDQALKALDQVHDALRSPESVAGGLSSIASRSPLVQRLLDGLVDGRLATSAIEVAASIPRGESTDVTAVGAWLMSSIPSLAGDPDRLAGAIESAAPTTRTLEHLATHLDDDYAHGSPRSAWLAGMARSSLGRSVLPESSTWWRGITIEVLDRLGQDRAVAEVLVGPITRRRVTDRAVTTSLERDPVESLPAVLALPDNLLRSVDGDRLAAAAERVDPATGLGRALRALSARATNLASERAAEELSAVEERARADQEAADRRLTTVEQERSRLAADNDRLRSELDRLEETSNRASKSELTQSRLDATRGAAHLVRLILNEQQAVERGTQSWADLVSRLLAMSAQHLDLSVPAGIGQRAELDRELYVVAGIEAEDPGRYTVLEPAVVLNDGSDRTILLRGTVAADDQ